MRSRSSLLFINVYRGISSNAENCSIIQAELQKRADCVDQSVLFFLAGANFWEKHAKNCAIMSILDYFWSILDLLFGANFFGGKIGRC